MRKIIRQFATVVCILFVTGMTQQVFAQPFNVGTLSIGVAEFNALYSGSAKVYVFANPPGSPTDFTATFTPVLGQPSGGAGDEDPCADKITTPANRFWLQQQANDECEPVQAIIYEPWCETSVEVFFPDPEGPCFVTWGPYQPVLNVYYD